MDDVTLAPILYDTALFDQQAQDLLPLDLPPIQDSDLTRAQNVEQPPGRPSTPAQSRDPLSALGTGGFDATPVSVRKSHGQDGQHHSTLPIASVLNEEHTGQSDQRSSQDKRSSSGHGRRRKRTEGDVAPSLQLPHPHVQYSTDIQLLRIPPLLQGLHDPPPDAGLFPRIVGDGAQRPAVPVRSPTQAKAADRIDPALKKPAEHTISHQAGQVDPLPSCAKPSSSNKKRAQGDRRNKKWSKEETLVLLKGVKIHGVGMWKKILADEDLTFHSRSAVDLKDRYRVVHARKHQKSPTSPTPNSMSFNNAKTHTPAKRRSGRGVAASKPTDADLITHDLPTHNSRKSSTRRERSVWSSAEDAFLTAGVEKYGAQWAEIIKDPALALKGRTRNDARDRWRVLSKAKKVAEERSRIDNARPASSDEARKDTGGHVGAERTMEFVDPAATWRPSGLLS